MRSSDGWVRTRMEKGRSSPEFRAVCDLCPWVGSLHSRVVLAEDDGEWHTRSEQHSRKVRAAQPERSYEKSVKKGASRA